MGRSNYTKWAAFCKGRTLAASIFRLSATFPSAEKYSLTDQVRRSSRSVCANLAESYAKRRYPKHFIAKLTDASGENYETQTWLLFANDHRYIDDKTLEAYLNASEEVGRLLTWMTNNPDHFCRVK